MVTATRQLVPFRVAPVALRLPLTERLIVTFESVGTGKAYRLQTDPNAPLSELFSLYADVAKTDMHRLSFRRKRGDVRLDGASSAKDAELREDDVVAASFRPNTLTVFLRVADTEERIAFKLNWTTPISKVRTAYAALMKIDRDSVHFVWEVDRLSEDSTPASIPLEEGDVIDVIPKQQGC